MMLNKLPKQYLFATLFIGLLTTMSFVVKYDGLFVTQAKAAAWTVCASGCTHTTISAAIAAASNGDTITVMDAVHTEQGITVNKDLTIRGQGATQTIVQANAAYNTATDNVFTISGGVNVTIRDMTIRHGNGGVGGAINNSFSILNVISCVVSDNVTVSDGGGIFNFGGIVNILNSTISNNRTPFFGGAISTVGSGNVSITNIANSTLSGNQAAFDGGGLSSSDSSSYINLSNSTVTNNRTTGGDGGGVYSWSAAVVTMSNSIVVGNSDTSGTNHPDISGNVVGADYNLIGNITGSTGTAGTGTDIVNPAPNLGVLANNGGNTPTHALNAGSPAINAGNPAGCTYLSNGTNPLFTHGAAITTDQRGKPRPNDGRCDIGAFEWFAAAVGGVAENITLDPTNQSLSQLPIGGVMSLSLLALTGGVWVFWHRR